MSREKRRSLSVGRQEEAVAGMIAIDRMWRGRGPHRVRLCRWRWSIIRKRARLKGLKALGRAVPNRCDAGALIEAVEHLAEVTAKIEVELVLV